MPIQATFNKFHPYTNYKIMKLSFTLINLEREELTISKGETLLDLYKREGYSDNGTPTNRIIEKDRTGYRCYLCRIGM